VTAVDDAGQLLERVRLAGGVPRHIAVIMDGNGRWAARRHLPRPLGHQAGMGAVREVVEGALAAGVEVLTLFAFSRENWQRPPEEIDALMALLEEYVAREREELRRNGVSVRVLGNLERLGPGARGAVERIVAETAGGTGLVLNLCISYGSRDEIAQAARGPRRWRRAGSTRRRWTPTPSPPGSGPRPTPIPTSSSAPPARCGSPTSCSGSWPTPSSG
jgi:undecaprenyl diphosphate synthase